MSEEPKTNQEKKYSTWTHISFNLMMFMLPATYGMFGTHFFWYYETEVLLPVIFVGIANVIYLLWDAINDPLIGYLSDKPNRFTKKYGRRFPYIVIMGIPTMLSLMLLFIPPFTNAQINPIPIFLWALTMLIIQEAGYTSVSLARALYPEKFRSDSERRKNAGIGIVVSNIGMLLGMMVPMIFVTVGNINSYFVGAAILMIPCVITFILGIPGVREDPEIINRSLNVKRDPFFKAMKIAFSKKNFLALIAVMVSVQVIGACIMGSIYYYTYYILLESADSAADILFMLSWFLAGLISIPFWVFISKKLGNRKLQIIALLTYMGAILPFIFIRTLVLAIVAALILGFMMGATNFVRFPIFSDLIDEATIIDGKRQEGIYQGALAFCDRFGILAQPLIFTVVHIITGFVAANDVQTPLAQQGIIAAMTWIPALIALVALLIFWKYYDITVEKTEINKKKLHELNL